MLKTTLHQLEHNGSPKCLPIDASATGLHSARDKTPVLPQFTNGREPVARAK